MTQTKKLPPQFASLEPFMDWALPTTQARMEKRAGSSKEHILAFHAAAGPQIDAILEYLNRYALDAIPPEAQGLYDLAMAIADMGLYAEWFEGLSEPPIALGLTGRITMIWEPGTRRQAE